MAAKLATVVVVPRERFSLTERSLESVLAHTPKPLEMVYIDGGSPAPVRKYLERQAGNHRFRLFRTDHYLTPNSARNMGLLHVHTKYAVFIDNDAMVSPGWLESLVDCAETTGAWVVGPIYCEREPIATRIHMAGGMARITEVDGKRTFTESHLHYGQPLKEIGPTLQRQPTEMIEFHAVLVNMEAFERLGPLDEGLMSAAEHTDLCLMTRGCGQQVFLEPKSVVTYLPPPPFAPTDLPYFQLRWSHAWNEATIARFAAKWQLDASDSGMVGLRQWLANHRRLTLEPYRRVLRMFGRGPARFVEKTILGPLEEASNRARYPQHLHGSGARRAA